MDVSVPPGRLATSSMHARPVPAPRRRRTLLISLAVTAAVAGGAAYWLTVRPKARAEAHEPAMTGRRPAAAAVTGTSGVRAARPTTPAVLDDSGPDSRRLAIDCARPTGDAALIDDQTISMARLCGRLRSLGGVDRGGRTVDRTQAGLVLDQLVDAGLVHRAVVAAGQAIATHELDAALVALGPVATQVDPALVREQVIERLEFDRLIASRGRAEVNEADVDAELARGAPGLDRGAGTRIEGWIARTAATAPASVDAAARQAAEAFALEVAAGRSVSQRTPLTPLAPFVLGDGSIEPALEDAIRALPPGAWSRAVRTRAGWVVVRVLGRVEPAPMAAGFRDRVRDMLTRRMLADERRQLVAELRAAARIELLLPR